MLSSQCAICGTRKSRFMKEKEAKGLLSRLGIKAPLSNIPYSITIYCFSNCYQYKIHGTVSKFILGRNKFMFM